MTNLAILNSTFTVLITIQNWTSDNQNPLLEALIKAGFVVTPPSVTQQARIHREKITGLGIDNPNRRIIFQITNEVNNPQEEIQDVLNVLSSIGFPSVESVERIDMQGQVTIKMQNDDDIERASNFVTRVVRNEFIDKTSQIFERPTKAIGIRVSSQERFTDGVSKTPFTIVIEPLNTDDTDRKFIVGLVYNSSNVPGTLNFMSKLYDRLKSSINALKVD